MRPIRNFAIHAFATVAIAAFAATSASADFGVGSMEGDKTRQSSRDEWVKIDGHMMPTAAGDDKSSAWIRMGQLPTGGSMAKGGPAGGGWIEIQGWDWEVERAAKIDSFTIKQGVKPVRPVGSSDLTMKRGTSPRTFSSTANQYATIQGQAQAAPSPPAGPVPVPYPNTSLDYDGGDTGTHEASGGTDKFGRVRVKFAWDGCAAGTRLPAVDLKDARTAYRLEDVTVANCTAEGATFNYARLRKSPAR